MSQFPGFPVKAEVTPLPNLFFSDLLPQIREMAELKVTLHVLWRLRWKKGYPCYVSLGELLGEKGLLEGLSAEGKAPDQELRRGLALAVERGTLLCVAGEKHGNREDFYFLNTEAERRLVERVRAGDLVLEGFARVEPQAPARTPSNVFSVYEENIGIITPLVAEELKEAERLYPPQWIEDAIREAVRANVRKWRYVASILERWSVEGRDDGEAGRHPQKAEGVEKYFKGKYGGVVKR